ncbi:MAG: transcriptional repressor [Candidatus Eremiobacteraeota bacterium]|nr:transcriptional repressor [Candidatus Eremiobacteraeota bacterium]
MVASGRGRKTRQRDALSEILERAESPLSVPELFEAASKRIEGLGVATVYRTIGSLLEAGLIETVEIPGEPTRYERSDKGHHHHFQCERCDRVFDIDGCLDNLRRLLPPKFKLSGHAVTLYGTCAACAR